jgi:hypothetical protein
MGVGVGPRAGGGTARRSAKRAGWLGSSFRGARAEGLVAELLDGVPAGAPVDLLGALAYPLPVILISELLGVPPEDRDLFKGWSDALARGLDPDFLLPADELARRQEAREEFAAYFRDLAARRRAEPRDDLLGAVVAGIGWRDDAVVAGGVRVCRRLEGWLTVPLRWARVPGLSAGLDVGVLEVRAALSPGRSRSSAGPVAASSRH